MCADWNKCNAFETSRDRNRGGGELESLLEACLFSCRVAHTCTATPGLDYLWTPGGVVVPAILFPSVPIGSMHRSHGFLKQKQIVERIA